MTSVDPIARLQDTLSGRYLIEREVGRGGIATVYLARDVKHKRSVALEALNPELGARLHFEQHHQPSRYTGNSISR